MGSLTEKLSQYILAMADDELILGHRDSQWCGHAPILEEDIAFANIALDEIGHAGLWYGLYAELTGHDPEIAPDDLIYRRSAREYRCTPMVELPNGDWAFSMLRQYLFDRAEIAWLSDLARSEQKQISAIAEKVIKEEQYHLRHTQAWVERLGQGSDESHRRMQAALTILWPYTESLLSHCSKESDLAVSGYVPDASQVRRSWQDQVMPLLADCDLTIPEANEQLRSKISLERGQHHESFPSLIAELQSVARLDPAAAW